MSQGSERVTIRLGADAITRIQECIRQSDIAEESGDGSIGQWIRDAIRMRLAHLRRAARQRDRRRMARAGKGGRALRVLDVASEVGKLFALDSTGARDY